MKNIVKSFFIIFILAFIFIGCNNQDVKPNPTVTLSADTETTTAFIDNTAQSDNSSTTQQSSTEPQQEATSTQVKLNGPLKAHFLDVGQADCIYIELPNNEKLLIDAGNNADKDIIINYLNSQGVKRLDYIIGTHPHEDHIGSMDAVISNYDIGSIYMPKVSSNTKTFEDLLTTIQNKGLKVKAPESGAFLINLRSQENKNTVKDELAVQILAPNSKNYDDINNYSIVIKLTFSNTSMLFMGDAEDVSEAEIISTGYDIKSNLIKVGHHGSVYSTTPMFLEDVQPQFAIISVGKGNDYGHPAQSTIDKLVAAGAKIFRTDEVGTITATSDGETIKIDKSASPTKEQAPPKPTVTEKPSAKSQDISVYITKTGKKYHLDGCKYLAKSKIPIKLSEAKVEGYTPCSVCKPPK